LTIPTGQGAHRAVVAAPPAAEYVEDSGLMKPAGMPGERMVLAMMKRVAAGQHRSRRGGSAMRSSILALFLATGLACVAISGASAADQSVGPTAPYTPVPEKEVPQFTYSWRTLPPLPRPLQNHCGFFQGHYVCADHCGPSYQVYFCTPTSIGCCHVGQGYCGGDGGLRCGTWPWVFPFPLN
jgi:hypothetical protein